MDALLRAWGGALVAVAVVAGALLGPGCIAIAIALTCVLGATRRTGTIGLALTVLLLSRIRPAVVAVAVPPAVSTTVAIIVSTTITARQGRLLFPVAATITSRVRHRVPLWRGALALS